MYRYACSETTVQSSCPKQRQTNAPHKKTVFNCSSEKYRTKMLPKTALKNGLKKGTKMPVKKQLYKEAVQITVGKTLLEKMLI